MNYSNQILGLPAEKVDFPYLTNYFQSPREESDTIEYKSFYIKNQSNYTHKERGIIKTVCAMLNSEGGLIVWGAPIEQIDQTSSKKYYSGQLSLIDKLIDKDQIISKISGSIVPLPEGIKLNVVQAGNNTCSCIIEVERSNYLPHQYENVYWIRLDGQTHAAPHHYIEAMMKQVKYPNLECYIKIEEIKKERSSSFKGGRKHDADKILLKIRHFICNWSGHINEEDVSFSVVINKGKFLNSTYHINKLDYLHDGNVYKPHKSHPILYYGEPITESYYIEIDPYDLNESSTIEIIFSIGGRKSPQKRSRFSIDLSNTTSENLLGGFLIIEDNKLVIDSHLDTGMNKDLILKKLLN